MRHSVGDEAIEATTEICQRYYRHGDSVRGAMQQRQERDGGQEVGGLHRLRLGKRTDDEEEYERCGDRGRGHEVACSQSWSGYSGVVQLRSRGGRTVGGHQGGVIVAGGVDAYRLGTLCD